MFYLGIIYKSFIDPKTRIFIFFFKFPIFITKFCFFFLHFYLNIQPKYKGQNWKLLTVGFHTFFI